MFGKVALYSTFLMSIVALIFMVFLTREVARYSAENLPAQVPSSAPVSALSWALFDPETGEVVRSSGADEVHPIASISKLFTAGMIMESARKHDAFTLVYSDIATEGRAGKLFYGEQYTPYQLLFPMLIESSNDAAVAVARELGGEFPLYVSRVTKQLALTDTVIVEPSGLSPENVSTARELAKFYVYLLETHPHVLDITQLHVYINSHTGYASNNPAREFDTFTGGKNGYIPEAGRTFVGTFRTDAGEAGIVLLGSSDVVGDIEKLLSVSDVQAESSDIMAR